MLKKMWAIVLVALSVLCIAGCKKEKPDPKPQPAERTYVADGSYVAFEYGDNHGANQLVWVTVEIKNDKIASVDINTIQSTAVKDAEQAVTGYAWNAKNKKQLGYEYYMFPASGCKVDGVLNVEAYKAWLKENNKLEWFEQVKLIEDKIVADQGTKNITVAEGKVTNITGVTVTASNYVSLAQQAIDNAKAGKAVAVLAVPSTSKAEYAVATATVNAEGKLSNVVLDYRQYKVTEGKVVWNAKTKQELGYEYYMFPASGCKVDGVLNVEAYKEWLKTNNKLEWFEQAELIVKAWIAGTPEVGENGKFTNVTNVTISDNGYVAVLDQLVAYGFKK